MPEPDKTSIDPVVKLMAYDVPEWRIRSCTEILTQVSTPEELDKMLGKQHKTIDWSQLLMPVFRPIYQREPEIRSRIHQALVETGISTAMMDEYFTELGDQPYLVFHLKYEYQIPLKVREHFNDSAAQTVLDTVKSYLGLMQQKPQHTYTP